MLPLVIVGGTVLFVGIVLAIVFTFVGRALRRQAAEQQAALESEGIERDSGAIATTIRYRKFRSPGLYEGRGYIATRRRIVLTRGHLDILGGRPRFRIPRAELGRYEVDVLEGCLHVVSDNPYGATGHVDLRLSVDDPDAWAAALRNAGCQSVRSGT